MTDKKTNVPATTEKTPAERFTSMVTREFTANTGDTTGLSPFRKRLVHNYFIKLDSVLRDAEAKRLKKNENYRDKTPITWENVNIPQLALDVVATARVGLDPALPNHVALIPFKNNTTGKYDINLMPEYRGKEIIAKKYGLEEPQDIIVELKYQNDHFKPLKKTSGREIEGYEFEVSDDPFDRGDLQGGFYYIRFEDPTKNRLRWFTVDQIEKRKPTYASAEFWGGEKDKWEKDKTGKSKKVGTEEVEGWYDEMCWKTVYRAACNSITLDSEKIDDDFIRLTEKETTASLHKDTPQQEADQNSNLQPLSFDDAEEIKDEPKKEDVKKEAEDKPKQENKPEAKKQGNTPGPKVNPQFEADF